MRAAALRFTGSGSRLSGYFEPRHYIDTVIDIYQVSVNRANSAPRYAIVIDFSKLVRSQCRVRPTRGWPAARRARATRQSVPCVTPSPRCSPFNRRFQLIIGLRYESDQCRSFDISQRMGGRCSTIGTARRRSTELPIYEQLVPSYAHGGADIHLPEHVSAAGACPARERSPAHRPLLQRRGRRAHGRRRRTRSAPRPRGGRDAGRSASHRDRHRIRRAP